MATKSLLSGELISDRVSTKTVLDKTGLHWNNKSGDTTIVWPDVIRAHCGKDWKKADNDAVSAECFTVHYIHHLPNKKWRHKQKIFHAPQNVESWVQHIEEKRTEGKAKRLLVVINPYGGQRHGYQIYHKTVVPLFELASISTEVIVTDEGSHADRIASTYDFTKVDGLIVVGGDGMYHLMVNRMLIRKQVEGGVDQNDPEVAVLPLDTKIGIIPTGTGNGIHGLLCGVKDVETAALHIIKGQTTDLGSMGIFEKTNTSSTLVSYTGLLFGYGFVADILVKTDERRWMRRMRYPVTLVASLFSKKRLFDAEIEYLTKQENKEDDEALNQEGAAASSWKKLEKATYMNFMIFVTGFTVDDDDKLSIDPSSGSTAVMLQTKSSASDLIKMSIKATRKDKELFNLPFLKLLDQITAFRFQVIEKDDNDNSTARLEERDRERVLNVDGEVYRYSCKNKIEVRFIPKVIQLFATFPTDKSTT
ncbi:ceramide kinase-like isoform X1 [Gigantopelta aegis]|uniref:ceramide kinase-like isoform X1 n=1 Tax=Gigantopelta aegis TaxID=1735272 RepID=UPI001B88C7D1|nr:ceramide kinase-like isoform X1 [Gigantopelta aegis]